MDNHSGQTVFYRQGNGANALQEYLEYLPILDRQVLQHRYLTKDDSSTIAREMRITSTHVERILSRAKAFDVGAPGGHDLCPPFPVKIRKMAAIV